MEKAQVTCFDKFATLQATGRKMAAEDNYVCRDINWSQVHPDFGARVVIEFTYLSCVLTAYPDLAAQAAEGAERTAKKYGFV